MRTGRGSLVAALSALVISLFLVSLQAAGQMKLLSASTGWVIEGNSLYWTSDDGEQWRDIAPIAPGIRRAAENLGSVFFRESSEGWVVISDPENTGAGPLASARNARTLYSIAHTFNGGDSWSFMPLSYPELPRWLQDTFAGPADLYFLDSLHGWMVVAFEGNSRPGKLLATEDGGKTWHWVNSPGFSGPIAFPSLRDGWLVGYFDVEKLYVTHDGCSSWQEVSLLAPLELRAATGLFQGAPIFQNRQKGYLVVRYLVSADTSAKLVVYSTTDGGKSWQPIKVLDEAREAGGTRFAVVDSTIIVSTGSSGSDVRVASVSLVNAGSSGVIGSDRGVIALSFVDPSNGWLVSAGRGILATHDGGSTWKHIGPSPGGPALH